MTPTTAPKLRIWTHGAAPSRRPAWLRHGTWLLAAGLAFSTLLACNDKPEPVAKQEPAKVETKPKKPKRDRPPRSSARLHDTTGREGYPDVPGVPAFLQPNAITKHKQRAVLKSAATLRLDKEPGALDVAPAPRDYEGPFRVMVLEAGSPMRVASWHRGVRLAYYAEPTDAVLHTTQATRVSSEPATSDGNPKPTGNQEVGIWLAKGAPVEPLTMPDEATGAAALGKPAGAKDLPAAAGAKGDFFKVRYDRHGLEFEGYVPKAATGTIFEEESFAIPEDQLKLAVGPRPKPGTRRGKDRMRRTDDPRDLVRGMDPFKGPARGPDGKRGPRPGQGVGDPPAAEGKNAPADLKAEAPPKVVAPATRARPAEAAGAHTPSAGVRRSDATGSDATGGDGATPEPISIYRAPGGDVLAKAKLASGEELFAYAVAGGEKKDGHQLVTFHYEDLILRGWVKESDVRPATRFDKPTPERIRRQRPDRAPAEWRRMARGALLYDKPKGEVVGAVIWRRRMQTSQAEPGWLKVTVDLGVGATATLYAEDKPEQDETDPKRKKKKKNKPGQQSREQE